jgi:hypothetical protein
VIRSSTYISIVALILQLKDADYARHQWLN